ncbi:DUF192 domain-containing protein [bacterium]|nr:DUF192 domain-containing protein [bacterium]
MSNHLKLLIYIGTIVGIFCLVQEKFDLFNVRLIDGNGEQVENMDNKEGEEDEKYLEIYIPNGLRVRVNVEVVDTEDSRAKGLSSRRYLGDYDGMLFVFEKEVDNPFWMKDMLIPIDIIFIDSKGYIVDIKVDEQPCDATYCPQIYSKDPYRYVLEVNAGFCEENEIEIGYSMVQYL